MATANPEVRRPDERKLDLRDFPQDVQKTVNALLYKAAERKAQREANKERPTA